MAVAIGTAGETTGTAVATVTAGEVEGEIVRGGEASVV